LSSLADRIRGIVNPHATQGSQVSPRPLLPNLANPSDPRDPSDLKAGRDLAALGGSWRDRAYVVERRWAASARHGRDAIGAMAERLDRASSDAALFANGAPAGPPFVFFDLETTGLSGGAGTLAFLVGCGTFDADGSFVTRQFLMTQYADERPLLEAVAAELGRAGALVSFNGKSFDAPLLETRFLFHRLAWNGREGPHVDVLHPARRFWKPDAGRLARFSGAPESVALGVDIGRPFQGRHDGRACTLQSLERKLLGVRRVGDVAGFEIPARYFEFVRSGDARPLCAILEHNRLDLLTLAALTARLLHLARVGPADVSDPREVLALGHVYARAGYDERARAAFRLAIERCRSPRGAFDPIRIEALRLLALAWRRARQYDEAAECWFDLLEIRGCPPAIEREATAALAIHHEHRRRDLAAAKIFALRSLDSAPAPAWRDAARYRLARLERKLKTQSFRYEL
jgi:uncharacterized protein YprB with RNaseH-like and TPR domain